jgi:hypothetical protein
MISLQIKIRVNEKNETFSFFPILSRLVYGIAMIV